ncbi:MAG: GNAT family N-acetyltransferase [Muribaculaceae bacterium]|nr:GNAT family N-acetyltransferase [Muribaculaceae bacterium]MDE6793432.1 GNAT family N-acetyltransferase [Muribaculaceae bacterium]
MKLTIEEFAEHFQIRKLSKDENIRDFDCGDEDLNEFLIKDAPLYQKALLANTYIIENKENGSIGAYFSLANDRIAIKDFPNNTEFNRFRRHRFVNEKRLTNYPAVKLCRFAVSDNVKGMSIGTFLLDYLKSWFVNDNRTGCRFITVDAYHDAEPFYLKNGFIYLTASDVDRSTRLMFFDLINIE